MAWQASLRAAIAVSLSAGFVLAACTKEGGPPGVAVDPANACADSVKAASAVVLDAVEKNRACQTDEDCVSVAVGASCFDACSRSVSKTGVDAVKAASSSAATGPCKGFKQAGCTVTVPPCAPPSPPRCVASLCQ